MLLSAQESQHLHRWARENGMSKVSARLSRAPILAEMYTVFVCTDSSAFFMGTSLPLS